MRSTLPPAMRSDLAAVETLVRAAHAPFIALFAHVGDGATHRAVDKGLRRVYGRKPPDPARA